TADVPSAASSPNVSSGYLAESFALFYEVCAQLSEESRIEVGFSENASLWLAFSPAEAQHLKTSSIRTWLDAEEARRFEPRIGKDVVAASKGRLVQVRAYPFCLALMRVAEMHGARLRSGDVLSVKRNRESIEGVQLRSGE